MEGAHSPPLCPVFGDAEPQLSRVRGQFLDGTLMSSWQYPTPNYSRNFHPISYLHTRRILHQNAITNQSWTRSPGLSSIKFLQFDGSEFEMENSASCRDWLAGFEKPSPREFRPEFELLSWNQIPFPLGKWGKGQILGRAV